MRSRFRHLVLATAALLALVLSGTLRAADTAPAGLPDTPAGPRATAFFEVFQSGSEERLAAFFSGAVSPESLKQRPAAERAGRLAAIRKEIGDVAIRRADAAAAGHLIVVTMGSGKRFTMWAFDFGPPPDAFLVGIGIDEADASDLAGPPPPMSEAGALAAVEKAATEAVAADRFSDVVLVARNGKTLLHGAWDLASREHGVANRPDTKFNLGSINVLFTKVAVGQLVQKGRLCLDDTVGKHLPDCPNPGARKATVTSSFPSEGALVLVRAALEAAPGG